MKYSRQLQLILQGNVGSYQLPTVATYNGTTYVYDHIFSQPSIATTCSNLHIYKENFSEYLACYTIINYLIILLSMNSAVVCCCCLLLWIILLSSSCNITIVDKTLILSILATLYNLSMQSFVTFAAFIKVNIYHMYLYISSSSHIVPT